jgi:glutathione synthase/RimK-type ligase-like ATP-grasp enzyme
LTRPLEISGVFSTLSQSVATRGEAPRVALVTCAELPDLEPDDRLLIEPLARRGIAARPEVWDDSGVNWAGYDLVLLRSPWDYARRREEFVAWAAGVPRLANPAAIVAGNTDKRYLARLAEAGVPVVPTQWLEPGSDWLPGCDGVVVVKPAVSAGSYETGRYDLADPAQRRLATAHADRLRAHGQVVMVQPYLAAVDSAGETALLYFAGRYSHAIRKGAMLEGPYDQLTGLYREERIDRREPSPAEREAADRVLAAAGTVLGAADLLYARVDLIPAADGTPTLVELELTEPSLFLGHDPGAVDRFADAIAARLRA